jgi:hypothetical protein
MLERLYVDNYRCLVNFECRLAPRRLILGPNGCGKSTLGDVLSLLRNICVHGDVPGEDLAGTTRTRWQSLPEQSFELDVSGNGGLYQFRFVVDAVGNPARVRILKEEVDFGGNLLIMITQG